MISISRVPQRCNPNALFREHSEISNLIFAAFVYVRKSCAKTGLRSAGNVTREIPVIRAFKRVFSDAATVVKDDNGTVIYRHFEGYNRAVLYRIG